MMSIEEQNDVLIDFTSRLELIGFEYMLTGSMVSFSPQEPASYASAMFSASR